MSKESGFRVCNHLQQRWLLVHGGKVKGCGWATGVINNVSKTWHMSHHNFTQHTHMQDNIIYVAQPVYNFRSSTHTHIHACTHTHTHTCSCMRAHTHTYSSYLCFSLRQLISHDVLLCVGHDGGELGQYSGHVGTSLLLLFLLLNLHLLRLLLPLHGLVAQVVGTLHCQQTPQATDSLHVQRHFLRGQLSLMSFRWPNWSRDWTEQNKDAIVWRKTSLFYKFPCLCNLSWRKLNISDCSSLSMLIF